MTCVLVKYIFQRRNDPKGQRMNHVTCESSSSDVIEDNLGKAIDKIELF